MILPHVLGFSSHLSIPLYCTLKSYMFIILEKIIVFIQVQKGY